MRTVQLHGQVAAGRCALVDDEDFELVSQYRWHVQQRSPGQGRRATGPYALTNIGRDVDGDCKFLYMHTLITGWPHVDHHDHDGLNNQRGNLRETTKNWNMANSRKRAGTTSVYKGVHFSSARQRWVAQIRVNGRRISLGRYTSEEAAARAYDRKALAVWGEHACPNFPEEAALDCPARP